MNITELAKKIAEKILADVTDRRGWKQEYYQMDDDIKKEIEETWIKEIKKILNEEERKQIT